VRACGADHTEVVPFLLALVLAAGGLHGAVRRGPITPVCTVGTPCSAPAAGAVLLFERGGHLAARVHVDAHGRYAVQLAPGVYAVELGPKPRVGLAIRPRTVRVVRGRARRIDFSIDTGIR
jgi:hypothetical protein